jgi:electron transfer flavoprotein beta subunit
MHVIVCVKQVPDTTQVRIDPNTGTLVREGIPTIVNPYDLHAIEEAIRLKEAHGGLVTVISMGPPQAKEAIREAISLGADEGILISDRAFAGSDTLATSYILSEVIKRVAEESPYDLIICGKQSIDGDTAQVGPGIARRLGLAQLTYTSKIRMIDFGKRLIVVNRQVDGGLQVVEAKLPALLTVDKSINKVRYAPLPNLIKAARYSPKVWNQEILELDKTKIGLKGSPTSVKKIFPPPPPKGGEVISEDDLPEKAADLIIEKLMDKEIV